MDGCVLHIDIDAFFASVEQLRNPRLRGKPVAVGSGVVASASYEARRFGLRAGMPLRKARELCPDLVILQGHAPIYRCFSEPIFALCAEYSPATETYLDEAYCDWRGTDRLFPDPVKTAVEMKRRILDEVGLTVTAGIGRNRMLAKMASKSAKPDGLRRFLPEEEESVLPGLPVSRLPGVGPRTERLLAKLTIRTIGDLRLLSRDSLRNMLGIPGLVLHDRCRGRDTQPVSAREIPRSIRRETSFHEDTIDRETIDGTLYYLTERAANTLRQLRLEARQVSLKIRYSDFVERSITRKLRAPTQLDSDLFTGAVRILEALYTRRVALRLIGVGLMGLIPDSGLRQMDLFTERSSQDAGLQSGAGEGGPGGDPDGAARWSVQPFTLEHRDLQARDLQDRDLEHRELKLLESLDAIRKRYGYSSVVCGRSLNLLGKLPQDDHGFILRTSSLTK